jgi:hypothetical protein
MATECITAQERAIKTQGFDMDTNFDRLPWHDAELISIHIDRSNAGNRDTVVLLVNWPDESLCTITFNDCYLFDSKMNFGIAAEESILDATCIGTNQNILEMKRKWKSLGVKLDSLSCYRITTNSTSSRIDIYALSYSLS